MTNFSKIEARLQLQDRVQKVSSEDFAAMSSKVIETINDFLTEISKTRQIKNIILYKPIQKYREVDLSPLKTAFPDVKFFEASQDTKDGFPGQSYDIVFVPLYGFNGDKYRLGHGAGWYDRFLASQQQAIKIGIGLSFNQVYFTPEPHDVPMDLIITEKSH